MKSMTGFGRGTYVVEKREYVVDIKSVNHKYSEMNIRMPRSISYLEDKIRNLISNSVSRGKIEVNISFQNYSESGKNIKINQELAKIYINELKLLASNEGLTDNISVMELTKLPDILTVENSEDEELIWSELAECVKISIKNFIEMRECEGNKLKEDIVQRLNNMNISIEKIYEHSTLLVDEYILKLEERIKELLKTDIIDQNRLAQEVVIYADKTSVEEELTRLKSHISQTRDLLEKDLAIGKKLDFIIQEMNREVNTICSKANNLNITKLGIELKTEIENIREQIQNIE